MGMANNLRDAPVFVCWCGHSLVAHRSGQFDGSTACEAPVDLGLPVPGWEPCPCGKFQTRPSAALQDLWWNIVEALRLPQFVELLNRQRLVRWLGRARKGGSASDG